MTASAAPASVSTSRKSTKASSRRRSKITLAGPSLGRDAAVLVGRRVVPCPFDGRPIQVSHNRRVDILAQERTAGRITEAQFLVGRLLQTAWEKQSGARLGSAGWDIRGSHDQTIAHELAILYALDDAEKVAAFSDRAAAAIGWTGVRILRRFLVEGQTFSGYAGLGASQWQIGKVGQRFRWLLEDLTEALHTARGAEGQPIRFDRHMKPPVFAKDEEA